MAFGRSDQPAGLAEENVAAVEIPGISFVVPFRPSKESAKAPRLEYPNLTEAVMAQAPFRQARERRLAAATPGSEEARRARLELRKHDLLECAWELQRVSGQAARRMWAQRFTEASLDIFGAPDPAIARSLAMGQLRTFQSLLREDTGHQERLARLCQFYERHMGQKAHDADQSAFSEHDLHSIAAAVRQYMIGHFGAALAALVQGDPLDTMVGPEETVRRFQSALAELQKLQPLWQAWRVELHDAGNMAVRRNEQRILVGGRREPLSLADLQGKFGHEVLVHALRYVNAQLLSDPGLRTALPGYVDAEEGLASLVDYAISGTLPRNAVERYVDISFAMGLLDGEAVPRADMFQMCLDRKIITETMAGKKIDDASVADSVWENVNRVYRGTPGEVEVGVFAKDLMYYRGFYTVAEYLSVRVKRRPVSEILDYLLSCKFNPFDAEQAARVTAARGGAPGRD